ncbi:pyridoxine 5'-phosphate oxidase C-terminal domain-containing protein [Umezawaea tangerina]|uniref:Pyridoxine 5'-phosphate oxidase-like protein n=1 Tax=Umezawaea tangerina TaxID=84725 RepID=A0A2T0T1Y9_9PSEU|nr:pyridoxine 5'-phosphate oxidase C-terminal domain-containing protein [Umezawaea tangerina]PRY39676.1 pyridoxine 5'-phosphate oxidase-like protein [Umezawaea tangerina]
MSAQDTLGGGAALVLPEFDDPPADQGAALTFHWRETLRQTTAAGTARGYDLPRPEGWAAHRLVPWRVEFWHGHASRLHRRHPRTADGDGWTARRPHPRPALTDPGKTISWRDGEERS